MLNNVALIQFNGIYFIFIASNFLKSLHILQGIEKRTRCFRFPAAPAALIQRAVCVWDNTSSRKDCGRARALNSNRARASHIKGRNITRASQALTHNLFGLTVFNNEQTLHVVHRFDEYQHFQRTPLHSCCITLSLFTRLIFLKHLRGGFHGNCRILKHARHFIPALVTWWREAGQQNRTKKYLRYRKLILKK